MRLKEYFGKDIPLVYFQSLSKAIAFPAQAIENT